MNGSVKNGKFLSESARMAIVAAVAAGKSQQQVAKDFNVHRNTVYQLCKTVRNDLKHPENPLARDYAAGTRADCTKAVLKAVKFQRDPYKAAHVALKYMEFIEGQRLQIDGDMNITVSWQQPAEDAQIIDVTPKQLSD